MVGLVEHGDLHVVEREGLLVEQVLEAARAGDDDVDAAVERGDLPALGHAAEDDGRVQAEHLGQRRDGRVDLRGELAGRGQHQGAGAAGGLALARGGGEPHDEREGERERLAGAGAAAAEDVAARQRVGQRGGLDGEGGGDALRRQCGGQGSGHAKIGERSHRVEPLGAVVGVRRQSNQSECSGGPPRRGARRFAQPLVSPPSHTRCLAGARGVERHKGRSDPTAPAPGGTHPDDRARRVIASARDLVKVYGAGPTAVRALDGVDVDLVRGRAHRDHGPVRLGQVDAHALPGRARPADVGHGRGRRPDRQQHVRAQAHRAAPHARRVRLPGVQPGADADRAGEHHAAARHRAAARRPRAPRRRRRRRSGSRTGCSHKPSELSGGQQQRVACARALVARPAVVFADEPTGNLDCTSAAEVLGFLRRSVDELGQSVVMVTHDPTAAPLRAPRAVPRRRPAGRRAARPDRRSRCSPRSRPSARSAPA